MALYIAMDTETGGLTTSHSVLTAYFHIFDEDFRDKGTLELNIKHPQYHVTPAAMKVNKINLEEHDSIAQSVAACKARLTMFLAQHANNEKLIPVGTNVAFDLRMLESTFGDVLNSRCSHRTMDIGIIFSFLKLCGRVPPHTSGTLSAIADHYKVKSTGAFHTAREDVLVCIRILKRMIQEVAA